jgi:hypothetical protein
MPSLLRCPLSELDYVEADSIWRDACRLLADSFSLHRRDHGVGAMAEIAPKHPQQRWVRQIRKIFLDRLTAFNAIN